MMAVLVSSKPADNRVSTAISDGPPHTTSMRAALGGRAKRSKLCPESLNAEQALFDKPGVGEPDASGNGFGHVPVALARACMTERLANWNAQANENKS